MRKKIFCLYVQALTCSPAGDHNTDSRGALLYSCWTYPFVSRYLLDLDRFCCLLECQTFELGSGTKMSQIEFLQYDCISSSSCSSSSSSFSAVSNSPTSSSSDAQDLVFHVASPDSLYTKRKRRPSHIFKATKNPRVKGEKDTTTTTTTTNHNNKKRKRTKCDDCGS